VLKRKPRVILTAVPKSGVDRIGIEDDFIEATGYRIPLLIEPVSQIIQSVKFVFRG
jgi:hypothetical protein